MIPLFYLHGKDSGPEGARSAFLREAFPHIEIPQLTNDVAERRAFLREHLPKPAHVFGNSLGGLTALVLAELDPEWFPALVLAAPAVGFYDPVYRTPEILEVVDRLVVPASVPTTIIAASRDEIIPLEAIEALIARSPTPELIEFQVFEEGHLLHSPEALAAQKAAVERMCGII